MSDLLSGADVSPVLEQGLGVCSMIDDTIPLMMGETSYLLKYNFVNTIPLLIIQIRT